MNDQSVNFMSDGSLVYKERQYLIIMNLQNFIWVYFIIIIGCILLGNIHLFVYTNIRATKASFLCFFFVSVLWIGIISNVILVPFSVPDESVHFAQSYEVSNGLMGIKREQNNYRIHINEEDQLLWLIGKKDGIQKNYTFFKGSEERPAELTESAELYRSDNLALFAYGPAAIGLTLARILKLPYQFMMILGRITNLMFLAICAVIAMKIYPPMRYAIASICLLPATVYPCAAYTYDVWNLAGVLLFVSICMRIRSQTRSVKYRDILILAAVYAAFTPVKLVYALLIGCVLVIPTHKWNIKQLIVIGGGVAGAIGIIFVLRGKEILRLLFTDRMDERGRTVEGALSYSLGYVLHHPLYICKVVFKTIIDKAPILIYNSAVGEEVGAPYHFVPAFVTASVIVVFAILMGITAKEMKITKRDRIVSAVVVLAGIFAIFMVFLFSFSIIPENGVGTIAGIQGRYFVPFLIVLPMVVYSDILSQKVRMLQYIISPKSLHMCEQEWIVLILIFLNYVVLFFKLIGIIFE